MRMRRFCLLFLLFSAGSLLSQNSISIDAVSTMHVCTDKNSTPTLFPPAAEPCATAPQPLSKIPAAYPDKARQKRKEGSVTLGLVVNKDGSVSGVHVLREVSKDIDQAAVEAVSQWKFEPGTYQGSPVDVETTVTVNFRLNPVVQTENPKGQGAASNDFQNLYSDASEAYKREDYATAANLFRRLTAISPQNGYAWNDLGRALLALNELDAAAKALQTSINLDPSGRYAYNNLGRVYWRQQKYEQAEAQFRKQMVVNPDDHYAHASLGDMLRDEHKCNEAMPELQKALSLSPNNAEILVAEGECDLDLGNRAKGLSELQQATSVSTAPKIFNSAAYVLAERNIELDMAEKWSERCLTIENTRLQNISLDHLTAEQLNYVFWTAGYWDTRGWIYFLRGENNSARSYLEAAWSLLAIPTVGDHLGQVYEKLGRSQDAARVYSMAIASADQPTRARVDADDLADLKKRLKRLAEGNANATIAQGNVDLKKKGVIAIPNEGSVDGSADFAVKVSTAGKPITQFHQLNGDQALARFADLLPAARLPVSLPESTTIEVPLRGILTCRSGEKDCRFALLKLDEAVNLTRTEMALGSLKQETSTAKDPGVYDDAAMGMRISLPDDWKLIRVEPGSFSSPRNAMFGKPGSTAMFMLTREHFEGPIELYMKMLNRFFSQKVDFSRSGEEGVKRDGLTGTRWVVSWNENGIGYSSVIEMFSVGDDYYRMTTLAPKEVYGRYAETFEDMLRSVQFPMMRVDSHLLDSPK